jgi:D-sedoheptulose 7-phosphate isomerase
MPMDSISFSTQYLSACASVLERISLADLDRVGRALLSAYYTGAQIFLAGNGGSAALASHFACDLSKTVLGPNPRLSGRRLRVQSLNDNVALLTAWANDEEYACVFAEPLKAHAAPGDVLLVITGSGNSENILELLRVARAMRVHTTGMLGFDGGRAKQMLDDYVVVEVGDYGIVEGVHGVLVHLLTAWIARELMRTSQPRLRPVAVTGRPMARAAGPRPLPEQGAANSGG